MRTPPTAERVRAAKTAAEARSIVLEMDERLRTEDKSRGTLVVNGRRYPVVIDDWDDWPLFLDSLQ